VTRKERERQNRRRKSTVVLSCSKTSTATVALHGEHESSVTPEYAKGRKCAQERNLKNCAYCDDYECEKTSKLNEQAPKARETLDKVRKNLGRHETIKKR